MAPARRVRDRSVTLSNKGDTLVEVLVSIAVVALILSGAYVTATRSLAAARDAQERNEAVQFLQQEVETLREVAKQAHKNTQYADIFDPNNTLLFCLGDDGAKIDFTTASLPELTQDDFSIYPEGCKNLNGLYNVAISRGNDSIFTFTARWYKLHGGRNQASLKYRIYPGPGVVAQTPAPPCNSFSIQIPSVEAHLWYASTLTYTYTLSAADKANFTVGCQASIRVVTSDESHTTYPYDQPNERVFLTFENSSGQRICETGLTDDLPTEDVSITSTVGACVFNEIPDRIVFKHWYLYSGDKTDNNSIAVDQVLFGP